MAATSRAGETIVTTPSDREIDLRPGGAWRFVWRRELLHRGLARREAGEDRAPGRVGEGGEGGVQLVW